MKNNKGATLVELMVLVSMIGAFVLSVVFTIGCIMFGYKAYNAIPEPPPAQVLDAGHVQ